MIRDNAPSQPTYPFGTTRCAGASALGRCGRRVRWVTTQAGDKNPMASCGVHLSWLIRLRVAPGASIKVTRLGGSSDDVG